MMLDQQELFALSQATGFRTEMLEKVIMLTGLLTAFNQHPTLQNNLALKGGTALNLFFLELPRLSIDIDLNYIGSHDRSTMIKARPEIETIIINICAQKGLTLNRHPKEHAGGKMAFQYLSALGNKGRIEIDLNFILRTPLWKPAQHESVSIGNHKTNCTVLDIHELIAGKLAALFDRSASRDLYDTYQIFHKLKLDNKKQRLATIVYGGMSATDWRKTSPQDITYDHRELRNQLIPVLHKQDLNNLLKDKQWTQQLLADCQSFLTQLFPLQENEIAFLTALLDFGEIKPDLITKDDEISETLLIHPGLKWKAVNVVKKLKGDQ
jgi:predicted nucleotidyltransferase component of viral defense system